MVGQAGGNNAYGLLGFSESGGGPTRRRLILYKENRLIGTATLDWQVDRYNRLKIGGEYTQLRHRQLLVPA